MSIMYIAHFRSDGEIQLVSQHLLEVMELAEKIGQKYGIKHIAGLATCFHDFGKLSEDFQTYIKQAFDNPENPPKRGSVDHSSAGGHFLWNTYGVDKLSRTLLEIICNGIYTHHAFLLDFITPDGESQFFRRNTKEVGSLDELANVFYQEVMSKEKLDQYFDAAKEEFRRYLKRITVLGGDKNATRIAITMLTKLVYSILIDCDRLNAKQFEENIKDDTPIDTQKLFQTSTVRLDNFLQEKQRTSLPNNITKLRQQMSNQCKEKSTFDTGIYTLSIPTGGGKTFASLRFALNHALHKGKKRIIYIIPFTTIIEQNVNEVREVLQTDEILEHHSNVATFTEDEQNNLSFEDYQKRRKLEAMKDNWDAPIIFTTLVQFLNTIYSDKSRNLRRFHNLGNSILIFDEIQTLPVSCVSLFNTAIQYLKDFMNTTTLLCTATQPALNYVQKNIHIDGELVENLDEVVEAFKRTNIHSLMKPGGWYTDEIADFIEDKLTETKNILVVMNNKSVVRNLYKELNERSVKVYHLSTAMCPSHRQKVIKEIRNDLNSDERFVCVSTQLIEAGVDVSFQCVMRSLAGIDSIAQSAGRCNRHGEAERKDVYVFNHAEENLSKLETIKAGSKCASNIIKDLEQNPELYGGDILSPAAIEYYFKQYYSDLEEKLDYPLNRTSIWELLYSDNLEEVRHFELDMEYPFTSRAAINSAAKEFKVIDAETTPIIVPYGEGKELIAELTSQTFIDNIGAFMKKAQQYSVNVFPHVKDQLIKNGLVTIIDFGYMNVLVAKDNAYDENYGLDERGDAKLENYQF